MPTSPGQVWPALFCLILSAAPPAIADETSRAHISDIAGSERLRLFAYGKLLDTGTAPRSAVQRMKQELARQGFYYDGGNQRLIAMDAWAAPILGFDGNINGGVLRDSFNFNGFVYEAAPEFRAKSGLIAGLSAGSAARLAWDNGRFVELSTRGEAVWSPEYQIGRGNAQADICSQNHLTGWTFLDLCHSLSRTSRDLGTNLSQSTDLSLSQLFEAGGYHELTATLSQSSYDIGRQTSVGLSWTAVWDHATTDISLTLAEPIQGETALRRRIEAGVKWPWRGRNVGLNLWQQQADGGAFLGSPRTDTATGIGLSYELPSGLTTQIGYTVNQSSIAFFRYDLVSVTVRFDALRW